MRLVSNRRTEPEGGTSRIPEKEFLLIHSQSVSVNSDSILIDIDKKPDPYFLAWIGHGTIVELDEFNPNKPKIKFNHSYWSSYTIPPDDNIVPQGQSEVDANRPADLDLLTYTY